MKHNKFSNSALQKPSHLLLHFLLVTFLILFSTYSYSASYYFSNSTGNDQYTSTEARNPNTPWKTIGKLNSFFNYIGAGDSILFKRGDVFEGAIIVTKSGAAFAPICFGAYGQGNKPVISGLVALWAWTSVGNGVYQSPCNSPATGLILNGIQQAMGRYPNKGYLSFESHNGTTSITDNQLTTAKDWTGGEVVIRKNRWTIDRNTITDHAGGTITYAGGNGAIPTNGYGYFIQNSIKTLDQLGEWYFDSQHKTMMVFFGSQKPDAYNVRTSVVNTLVDIRQHNFINFENLAFIGASVNAFHLVNSKFINLKNCTIDLTGSEAVLASYSPYLTIENSSINHSLSGGITLDLGCTEATIINNQIKNIGLIPGLGNSGTNSYMGITAFGDNTRIEKNNIDSIGHNGIYLGGNSSIAKNNFINYFCLTKDDGAGIYIGDWSKTINKKVTGNIVLHGIGNGTGTKYPKDLQAEGIYMDDNTESVTISDNTVSLCANNGIKIHDAQYINVTNNTVFNNGVQLRMEQDHYIPTSSFIRNDKIKNNVFFSKTGTELTAKFSSQQDDITAFGQLDSNFYCRPIDEMSDIMTSIVRNGANINQSYDLSTWKSSYAKDQLSAQTPHTFPAYKVTSLLGSNMFGNGNFDYNINDLYWYSPINDCSGSYSTGVLDGGALKLSFNASAGNHVIVNLKVGKITANKNYVLKFSLLGNTDGKSLQTYLRKTGAPYSFLSGQKNCRMNSTRTENEVLFSSTADDNDASIIFDIDQPSGDIYFDNVQLYEAEVATTNPDDYLRFEYNASNYVKTITLNKPYTDVHNNTYTDKVNIDPYSSIILISTEPAVAKLTQTILFASIENKTYGNTPITIAPVASSGLPVTLKVISGPASISGNTVKFNAYGNTIIQATQPGNEKFEATVAMIQIANTPVTGVADLAKTQSPSMKAYPNPFTNNLTVEFTTPVSGNGSLMLYNLQGNFAHQIYSGSVKAGELQKFVVDADSQGMKQGLYVVKLITNNKVLYQKVMLVK